MLIRQAPAMALTQLIDRHQVQPHLTCISGLEVAKLAAQIEAALTHQRRGKGGVAVRRNIPVIGHRHLGTVDIVKTQCWRQQA